MASPTKEIKYEKLDHREHVLLRPDTYLGSIVTSSSEYFVFDDQGKIKREELEINPGLLQIFLEALTNATDNKTRSEQYGVKCKRIEVTITESGKTKVLNDGITIPIEIDKKVGVYVPEMIFGMLLTSANYDDTVKREVAGRNGIGIKATSIFSKAFRVRIYDSKTKKLYEQTWSENMSKKGQPKISTARLTGGSFVEVTYIPDFERFGMKGYTKDTLRVMYYQTVIAAMLSGIKIKYNGDEIDVANLTDFARLFTGDDSEENVATFKGINSEAVLIPKTNGGFIGFVNGIYTPGGGVHVDIWSQAIFKALIAKLEAKMKCKLTLIEVKRYFMIFVKCVVDKPCFTGQFKDKLVSPKIVEPDVGETELKKVLKWDVINKIKENLKTKDMKKLKVMEKRKGPVLESYDPSNKKGKDCTLILTEGLSAKTFAVKGINVGCFNKKGRTYFGLYALRGKVLNVRNSTPESIAKNAEISGMVGIIGLKVGVDYTDDKNFKSLRYGKVLVIADSDEDGKHICGLILNFIHYLYPTLLQREDAFIYSMMTPIIRLTRGKTVKSFYTHAEYKKYASVNDVSKHKHHYFKGLGTSTDAEIKDCFGKRLLKFTYDEDKDEPAILKAFQKDMADARKVWIKAGKPEEDFEFKTAELDYPISSYIDNQLIEYSLEDCHRSLPNVIDGLKESQRKILYACFLKNLKEKMKVAQLSGFVAEKTNYHHGENNLCETIIGMAQDFVGSNNVPLLERHGQYGSRLAGGQDAAQPRYIFTSLEKVTRLIYREEDDCLLDYLVDEGDKIEPKFYVPIIPMVLVNGSEGIGTGWSCKIPCFNPKDIISRVRDWIDGKEIEEITPWYKGYKGKIEKNTVTRYTSQAVVSQTGNKVKITELPIGVWTDDFKVKVEKLLNDGVIKGRENNSTSEAVNFELKVDDEFEIESLKLFTYIHCSNLVCYDDKDTLQKYKSVKDIIAAFCEVRLRYYTLRKQHIIKTLEKDLLVLRNKYKFLTLIINRKLDIMGVPQEEVESSLEELEMDKVEGSYDYLVKMPINSFTKQKLEKLEKGISDTEKRLEDTRNKTEKGMWLEELSKLESYLV